MVFLGIIGSARFPDLTVFVDNAAQLAPDDLATKTRVESDRITLHMLQDLQTTQPSARLLVILFIAAIVAATMSTIDSALLAISSLITRDLYHPIAPDATQHQLTMVGKLISVVLMAVTVAATIALREISTIWSIIQIKLELLCQLAPAFFLGLHWSNLRGGPVLAGLVTGTVTAIALKVLSPSYVEEMGLPPDSVIVEILTFFAESGISPGIWGLALNLIVVLTLQQVRPTPKKA